MSFDDSEKKLGEYNAVKLSEDQEIHIKRIERELNELKRTQSDYIKKEREDYETIKVLREKNEKLSKENKEKLHVDASQLAQKWLPEMVARELQLYPHCNEQTAQLVDAKSNEIAKQMITQGWTGTLTAIQQGIQQGINNQAKFSTGATAYQFQTAEVTDTKSIHSPNNDIVEGVPIMAPKEWLKEKGRCTGQYKNNGNQTHLRKGKVLSIGTSSPESLSTKKKDDNDIGLS